jgi:proteasome lid subunit RPN8/RPN11
MAVVIIKRHFLKIVKHCGECHPAEAGGFLGGKGDVVLGIFPIPNAAYSTSMDEKKKFQWAPWDVSRVAGLFEKYDIDIIGFYHSHPNRAVPIPSKEDVKAHKLYNLRIMMIVSLGKGDARIGTFTVANKLEREKLKVIEDRVITKYLVKLDRKKSSAKHIQEMQRLEKLASKVLSKRRP